MNPKTSSIDKVLEHLDGVREQGAGFMARCPAHEDKKASLSISVGKDGETVLMKCHAGCDNREVAKAAGFSLGDLFPPKVTPLRSHNARQPRARIVATYDYVKDGQLRFQVVRRADKTFSQRRPDGTGGWMYNLHDVERVLYHHDEVIAGPAPVYIPEGEKDVDRLRKLGLNATTCPGGAGKWRAAYTNTLAGYDVVILPDNDDPGRKHAQEVATQLYMAGCSVKIAELPDLPEKGDVSDWLDLGNSIEDVIAFVNDLPDWKSPDDNLHDDHATSEPLRIFPTTDTGNAERLVHHHGENLRYIKTHKAWMVWNGTHWEKDNTGRVDQFAKATVRAIPEEATNLSGEEWTRHLKWALSSESSRSRTAMIDLSRSEDGIPARPEDFDRDPWLLKVLNGTLDLRTGKLRPHDRRDMISKMAPVAYDPTATCPLFLEWLNEIMLGRGELVTFLQRAIGYSLTGKVSERVVFILHGGGRNGKTTLLETVGGIMGNYAGTAPAEMLLAKREAGIPNDVARLPGARFVSATETGEGRRLDEVKVKSISGGDTIQARFMHADWFDFRPTFKIWLGTNHKPEIRGTDNAIWDRIRLIPFDYRVSDNQKITDLSDTFISKEASGILTWIVEGCLAWQREGLGAPADVMQATAGYRREMDPLANWIEDRCELRRDASAPAKALYASYTAYCESAGEDPLKQRMFGTRLTERGCGERKSGGTRYRTGIRILDPDEPVQATFGGGDTSQSNTTRDNTSHDMSHQKAHDYGDSNDQEEWLGHMGHDFRGNRPIETPSRSDSETSVPYVPYVPKGEAGNDPWTH
jgi:putative DNA primase/helicase